MEIIIYLLFFFAGCIITFFLQREKWNRLIDLFQKRLFASINNSNSFQTDQTKSTELNETFQKILIDVQSALAEHSVSNSYNNTQGNSSVNPELLKKSVDNLYIVNELGRRVTSSLNLEQTFKHLYTTINSMMDAAVLELNCFDEETNAWKLFSNFEHSSESDQYQNHIAEWSVTNNREVFLADAERDFGRYVFNPLVLPDGKLVKSIMVFPITDNGKVAATLSVMSFQKNMFGEYHQEIIRLLLGYIAVAMNNSFTHDELNRTKIRAEQSEKFKEQFLANMSHEIRTPIHAVTGMTNLLIEKNPRSDQITYLESIKNASDSLLVIINDILDLSKIEAGKVELEKIDFSIHTVVSNLKEIMQFRAEEKGLIVTTAIDSLVAPVLIGDPTRLLQILLNLVGNAVKFTDKGEVQITVTLRPPLNTSSQSLLFGVTDTGIGMTADQLQHLFQDYVQASAETNRKYGGTGLGLSISKQLVQLMGGTIHVESEPGNGSTFSFILSFEISKNKIIPHINNSVSIEMLNQLKGIKVLLADDNEYNRIVTRETLELKIDDVIVHEATDGEMAVEMAENNTYDIILMDLVMPKRNGLEATKMIRQNSNPKKNNVVILALTASVIKSEVDKSFEAGMNGFIPKPFKSYELILAVYKALHGIPLKELPDDTTLNQNNSETNKIVNRNLLLAFAEGDPVRQQRFIDLFLSKTPDAILKLKNALRQNDFEAMRIIAHSIKPQLQYTGITKGWQIADDVEQICSTNANHDSLPSLVEQLQHLCEQAAEELRQ